MRIDFINFIFGLVVLTINSLAIYLWILLISEGNMVDYFPYIAISLSALSVIISANIIFKSFKRK